LFGGNEICEHISVSIVASLSIEPSHNLPMTVFWPTKASLVAVNSALPMLVRGQAGSFEGELILLFIGVSPKERAL
jgi:hypothetical protein